MRHRWTVDRCELLECGRRARSIGGRKHRKRCCHHEATHRVGLGVHKHRSELGGSLGLRVRRSERGKHGYTNVSRRIALEWLQQRLSQGSIPLDQPDRGRRSLRSLALTPRLQCPTQPRLDSLDGCNARNRCECDLAELRIGIANRERERAFEGEGVDFVFASSEPFERRFANLAVYIGERCRQRGRDP